MMKTKISTILKLLALRTSLLLTLLLITSCDNKIEYKYFNGLKSYLKSTHSIDSDMINNTTYYLIPVSNSCDSCIKSNLELLSSIDYQPRLLPILIGRDHENDNLQFINKIIEKFPNTKIDQKEEIYSYQTGFGKPLIININRGTYTYFLEVTDFKIDEAKNYLENISHISS